MRGGCGLASAGGRGGAAIGPRLCPQEGSELGRGRPEAAFCGAELKLK